MAEPGRAAPAGTRSVRAFVAVPLPDRIVAALGRTRRAFEKGVPDRSVRWVRPEGIHLTLKFLGDTPVDLVTRVEDALSAVARNAPAFTFTVEGAGCFPNLRRPRVVWVGVSDNLGRLQCLQQAIEEALQTVGFPAEGRRFTPHLTLGRIGRRASRRDAARVGEVVAAAEIGELGEVAADRFELIRSVLKPTGAEYSTLAEFPLGTAWTSS